jgi:hypothetical protein
MKKFFASIKQYPSAIVGLTLILFLVGLSIYVVIAIPYDEAVQIWRGGKMCAAMYPGPHGRLT